MGDGRSVEQKARELLADAIKRVGLDAVRRSIRPKRASGEHRYVPSDHLDPLLAPALRKCRLCNEDIAEGNFAHSRMGTDMVCANCRAEHPQPHDLPAA